MTRRRSLYHEYPDYRVDLDPHPQRVRVRVANVVLAESDRALLVRETKHEPVFYLPMDDVRRELLEPSDHRSFCPFKGEASYWSLRLPDRVEENLLWTYEDPFDEVAGLEGYVAFYPERVEWEHEPRAGG